MQPPFPFGALTEHTIGILMQEVVRRANQEIWRRRSKFCVHTKPASSGNGQEIVTDADPEIQKIYVEMIRENFPGYGIIGEENKLRIPCSDATLGDMYFVVDPIDGTNAFARRQSQGIGTMIALIRGQRILAVYIGDVMTGEIYGYRPKSDSVHRINYQGVSETLTIDEQRPLSEQYLLLNTLPEHVSGQLMKCLVRRGLKHGLFKSAEITGGSIGIRTARIWKSELGATIFCGGRYTPWDMDPVMGISEKLGFVFLAPNEQQTKFVKRPYLPSKDIQELPDMLMIHKSRLHEFTIWQSQFLA